MVYVDKNGKTSYEIGEEFERYVLDIFPEKHFSIVWATPRKSDLNGRKMEESKLPDYKFRDKETGMVFWVECKYRSKMDFALYWCSEHGFTKYKETRETSGIPVIVVIGIGGKPDKPYRTICLDIDAVCRRYFNRTEREIYEIKEHGAFTGYRDIYAHTWVWDPEFDFIKEQWKQHSD